jgi:hypothetical protein
MEIKAFGTRAPGPEGIPGIVEKKPGIGPTNDRLRRSCRSRDTSWRTHEREATMEFDFAVPGGEMWIFPL